MSNSNMSRSVNLLKCFKFLLQAFHIPACIMVEGPVLPVRFDEFFKLHDLLPRLINILFTVIANGRQVFQLLD